MKNIHNKWVISLSIALIISLVSPTVSYGMKRARENGPLTENFLTPFKEEFIPEVQQKIQNLMLQDAITFLSWQPIILTGPIGHTGGITSVAINGNIVVTGSRDNTAKIWDISNGDPQLLHTLIGHTGWINSVAISNNIVATGSFDHTAKIWDISNNQLKLLATTPQGPHGHMSVIKSVAIQGNIIVTGSWDGTAKVWYISNNKLQLLYILTRPNGHTDEVSSVAISDKVIVTGSKDRTAKVWDISNGQLLHTIEGPYGITSVAISGNLIVTGSSDGMAKLWDIGTGQPQLLYTIARTNGVTSVAIHNNIIAIGLWNGITKIWKINNNQLQLIHVTLGPNGHTDDVGSVVINDKFVVTGSNDKTAKIWPLSPNLQGTPQNNPLLWITQNATLPQANFINRAYEATSVDQEFIIAFPSEDAKVFLSFPRHVKQYLLDRLTIRR